MNLEACSKEWMKIHTSKKCDGSKIQTGCSMWLLLITSFHIFLIILHGLVVRPRMTYIMLPITAIKRKCNLSNATYVFKSYVTLFFSTPHSPLFNAFIHHCCQTYSSILLLIDHQLLLNVFANRLLYVNWFKTLLTTRQKFFIVFIVIGALRP